MYVRFEVLAAVVMKSSVFWDATLCSTLKINQCFRGTCRLHLQGQRTNQHEAGSRRSSADLDLFDPEDKGNMKCQLTFSGLHNIVSQKIELFVS
jgi:hypothetical protein